MKIGIVGSRWFQNEEFVRSIVEELRRTVPVKDGEFMQIVSGGATGPDTLAYKAAFHFNIPYIHKPPDYTKHKGARALFERNTEIVQESDLIVAIWDRKSKGTKDTVNKALDMGKDHIIINVWPAMDRYDTDMLLLNFRKQLYEKYKINRFHPTEKKV